MKEKPTVGIWLDNRRQKKDNRYPVKVRITYKRERYYYPTNVDLTKTEFETAISAKPGAKLREIHIALYELERKANIAVNKITEDLYLDFSISLFEKYLNITASDYSDVFNFFERKINELKDRKQIRTACGYQSANKIFKEYVGNDKLSFTEINSKFIEGFETYMIRKNRTLTTVGVYTRYLRTIFNQAIAEKIINSELYPFGRNGYTVPQPANNKRSLDYEDILKVFQYKPEQNSWEDYAKDMWTLSLLCQGINLKDIANLKFQNIQGNQIVFIREKTKRTKKANQMPIVVYSSETVNEIIHKWGKKYTSLNDYIFPIYDDRNSDLKNLRRLEQHNKMINKYIRIIGKTLKIKQDITFYAARHSFATTLKRQGRSIEEIQEFLGHADKKTTERYLASFSDDHKRSIMNDFTKSITKNSNEIT